MLLPSRTRTKLAELRNVTERNLLGLSIMQTPVYNFSKALLTLAQTHWAPPSVMSSEPPSIIILIVLQVYSLGFMLASSQGLGLEIWHLALGWVSSSLT